MQVGPKNIGQRLCMSYISTCSVDTWSKIRVLNLSHIFCTREAKPFCIQQGHSPFICHICTSM